MESAKFFCLTFGGHSRLFTKISDDDVRTMAGDKLLQAKDLRQLLLHTFVGNGFRLLLGPDEKAVASWKKVTAQVDQRSEKIADDLLSRRQ